MPVPRPRGFRLIALAFCTPIRCRLACLEFHLRILAWEDRQNRALVHWACYYDGPLLQLLPPRAFPTLRVAAPDPLSRSRASVGSKEVPGPQRSWGLSCRRTHPRSTEPPCPAPQSRCPRSAADPRFRRHHGACSSPRCGLVRTLYRGWHGKSTGHPRWRRPGRAGRSLSAPCNAD